MLTRSRQERLDQIVSAGDRRQDPDDVPAPFGPLVAEQDRDEQRCQTETFKEFKESS